MPTKSKIRYQIIWICYYLFKIEEKAHTHSIDYVHIWTQLFLLGICWKIPKNSLQLHENLIDSKCSGDFKNVSFRTQKKTKTNKPCFTLCTIISLIVYWIEYRTRERVIQFNLASPFVYFYSGHLLFWQSNKRRI